MHPAAKRLRDHKVSGNEQTNKEYEHYGDGGFAAYFRNKLVKLDTQAKDVHTPSRSIFKGCVVYITGYTKPSAAELKRLIVENGGSMCAFLAGKSYATHIIAESLTSRKIEQYANCKVVKPQWVVDSVKEGRLLDWTKFRTIRTSTFFDSPEPDSEMAVTADPRNPAEHEGEFSKSADLAEVEVTADSSDDDKTQYIYRLREQVNCLAPNFVADYYARSRLHFLSTSKIALRQRCQTQGRPKLKGGNRTILHIDYDSFFVSIALKKRPDLKDKPMCVSHGSSGSDIASCNYVAREKGVANGMWVGHARKLCPDLACLPYDFAEYTRCSNVLYDTLLGLGPEYVTAVSVDEALVDVTNLASTVSEIEALASSIRNTIRSQSGIEVSIGAGPNILLAKVALRKAKPAGYYYIPTSRAVAELAPLPVNRLPGVGGRTEEDLNGMGIRTVADLSKWSVASLQSKLGKSLGKKLANDAQGISSSDISELDIPLKSAGVEICWGVRTVSEDEMEQFALNLTAEFFSRLHKECDVFTVKLYRRAPNAPFVTPKYMGCGRCDITSRSRRVSGKMELEDWTRIVVAVLKSLECPPLEFRGLGLHVKFKEKQEPSVFSKPSTPTGKRKKMVALQPRKRHVTLTQMNAAPIDMAVFDTLPTEIRREILMNEHDFNVVVPTEAKPPPKPKPEFVDVGFLGSTNHEEIRTMVRRWVRECAEPCAEDVATIRDYVDDVIAKDPNWTKAVSLVNWLGTMLTENHASKWHKLHQLLHERVQSKVVERI